MVNYLDILGASLGLICTYFLIRAKVWTWPIGLLTVSINGILFGTNGLYADMSLQVLYFFSMIYGWYYWSRGGAERKAAPISYLSNKRGLFLLVNAGILIVSIYYFLTHYTNSTFPIWDAVTTGLSLLAQYLACRKIIENWLVWCVVDSLYVVLYVNKHLYFHSLENSIYVAAAIIGFLNWRKLYAKQHQSELASDVAMSPSTMLSNEH